MKQVAPALSYAIPTQHYVLADHQLRATARQVAFEMAQTIREKNIDPNNAVFAFGEAHGITQINLFGLYMMEALQEQFHTLTVCDEKQNQYTETYLKPPEDLTLETLPVAIDASPHNKSYPFYSYAAHALNVHYKAVDLNSDSFEEFLVQGLDADFIDRYGHVPLVANAYQSIAHKLPDCKEGGHVWPDRETGATIRDLSMTGKILQTNTPCMTINGYLHLTDCVCCDRATLQEFLLANGKDLFVIQASPGADNLEERKTRQDKIIARMDDKMLSHLHSITYIQTGWDENFSAATIRRIMAAQTP